MSLLNIINVLYIFYYLFIIYILHTLKCINHELQEYIYIYFHNIFSQLKCEKYHRLYLRGLIIIYYIYHIQ